MKNLKKLLAVLLVVMMTMTLTLPAMAADEGTINVTNVPVGKKVSYSQILVSSTGEGNAKNYTAVEAWQGFFKTTAGDYTTTDGYKVALTAADLTSPSMVTVGDKVIYIQVTDSKAFANAAFEYLNADNNATATEFTTAASENGVVSITGLTAGYYVVFVNGASIAEGATKMVAMLRDTAGETTVALKSDLPTVEKTENKDYVQLGEDVEYTVTATVPDTTGYDVYNYTFTDVMTNLVFDGDIKVEIDSTTVYEKADGEVTINFDEEDGSSYTNTNSGYTLVLNMLKYQEKIGKEIKITYTAKITEAAIDTKADNVVTLKYNNDPTDSSKTAETSDDEHVASAKIVVDKFDGNNTEQKLAGAKFVLKNTEGKYYILKDGVVSWGEETDATVVTTDSNGAADFKGLTDGTYTLIEKEAPANYNKADDKTITISKKEYEQKDSDGDVIYLSVSQTAQVANYSGSQLPETGGIGTTIFYVVGGLLMVGAAVLFVAKKRMAVEK